MTKGWLKKTSWVLTRYVWVNKRYLSSKCFAGVAEPTCKDESLLKKPVWIPFLSIFTTAVGFFIRGEDLMAVGQRNYCVNTEINFYCVYVLGFQRIFRNPGWRWWIVHTVRTKAIHFLCINSSIFENATKGLLKCSPVLVLSDTELECPYSFK